MTPTFSSRRANFSNMLRNRRDIARVHAVTIRRFDAMVTKLQK